MSDALFEVESSPQRTRLRFQGAWTISAIGSVDALVRTFQPERDKPVLLDISEVEKLDTAGAWILFRLQRRLSHLGPAEFLGLQPSHQTLLSVVEEHEKHVEEIPALPHPLIISLERLGESISDTTHDAVNSIGFFGLILSVLRRTIVRPKRFRLTSFVHHMELSGFDALPIILLITFMIGAVVAFMGADILQELGVEVYTVDLVTITYLREFGVLLTAIMIAGRSGSAFTAQIGSMKAHEEIDAMRALGLDPFELLVLPRTLALLISLPLLTIIADVTGIIGGATVCYFVLDISPNMFIVRMAEVTELRHLWVGLIKAPFLAILIAVIGCYQGLRVEGTAESIGAHTTTSVVQAIFATIIVDASFAMFFQAIDM